VADLFLKRAVIVTTREVTASLVKSKIDPEMADEIIILSQANQADWILGNIKISGNEPKTVRAETLLRHVLRAVGRRFGQGQRTTQAQRSKKQVFVDFRDRIEKLRPDAVYCSDRLLVRHLEKLGYQLFPGPL
jgi:hypothetical protein